LLLYTGGVKSWSIVSALQEIGMVITSTSVRKSTDNDKDRIKALMGGDAHMVDAIPPRDMYAQLARGDADIMLSGGRTQFVALKARVPWLDINQERHEAYAGYDGMVTLVHELHRALTNQVWQEVRRPAPWDIVAETPA
jgi:nitrogenase molybdenum-cofactor synthesis protein NifE